MFEAIFFFLFASVTGNFLVEEECLNYTVYPVQYELTIIPFLYKENSYYHCEQTITVIANANVRVIELDAKELEIQPGSIKVLDGDIDIVSDARPNEYDEINGKLYIYLREPLKIYTPTNAQFYYIKIVFTKRVKKDSTGVFLVKYYEDDERNMKYMYTTRLSPSKAKFSFPCFDNPRFEAVFKFRVYVPPPRPDMQYANTSLVIAKELKRESSRDNYTIIEYMPSPQVALHQVGFHYSQFTNKQAIAKSTNDTLIIWAPEDKLKYYDFILKFGESIINLIHSYSTINRPLLYGPINIVAVPTNLNGYEIGSWYLLTNGANRMANVEQLTSIKQIDRMTFELAQQLCRIWLGNPGELERTRWKEEWFKEGMATYFAYYFLAQYYYGPLNERYRQPLDAYGLHMKHTAMAVDWHRSTPALEAFNNSLAIEIPSRYKDLVTMKTGAILWMLENWLQSEKFHQALVKYINSRRGKYISLQDFVSALDYDTVECSHQFFNGSTASRILKSWFHQPGYPVINVQVLRDRTPNAVQLKQRQFSFTQENRGETEYLIPISYLVQNRENCFNCYRPRFTIGKQTYTFSENLDGGWIILNRNASGYYRVNYDSATWRLIGKTLREDMHSIDEMNRAEIVNDVLALYVAGDLDLAVATEVLDYLDKETSAVVWNSVISGFELMKIEGAACHMDKHMFWEWEDFMSKKVSKIYKKLVAWDDVDQQPNARLFRSNIVTFAAVVNHEPCLKYLRYMFEDSRRGKQILDPDTREACYYMLSNDTNNHFVFRKLNPIEEEDRMIADHKIRERYRFLIKIPYGVPRPMPLISTETPSTQPPVTEKMSIPDNSVAHTASLLLVLLSLLLTFLR
ncbi:aminopeptidase N [Manduca sexta]|uniref:Aminopeptidase N n=1 Tax=Manduca sexta TaxID=7130 RepID=A0A921ZJ00_MANSE|nr:aminopeptidase N [Manduca sexta]KAG6458908.1 hypothetical protein O3G_MSEX011112 [Manduca sexta]